MLGLLANLVLVAHLGFVLFVIFGAVLTLRWPRVAWVHVPAAVWGFVVEAVPLTCPLTPLENWLRQAGGEAGYSGDFIDYYARQVLYAEITRGTQVVLGASVVLINTVLYGFVLWRARMRGKLGAVVDAPPN
jgi:hypothetical protein